MDLVHVAEFLVRDVREAVKVAHSSGERWARDMYL